MKWEGWTTECNTWEPLDHLLHSPLKLEEYCSSILTDEAINELCSNVKVSKDISETTFQSLIPPEGFTALKSKFEVFGELLKVLAAPLRPFHVNRLKTVKEALLLYFLYQKREDQLLKLAEWETYLNESATEDAVLKVENNFDLEQPPQNFIYTNIYISTGTLSIPDNPPIGCECFDCGYKNKYCCGRFYSTSFNYRHNSRINVKKGVPIYECNKACKCGWSCQNRVVQHGRQIPLCIFRTSNGCGWGVKALKKIHIGEFICEYLGEIINHEEAERRGEIYDAEGRTYLFDLDFNMSDNPYTVDAAKYGNVSHFINHSCDPNLGVWAVWIDCLDPNLPTLTFFALREIQKGEELTFDYMSGSAKKYKKNKKNIKSSPGRTRLDLYDEKEMVDRPICKCGARTCRRYLF